MGRQSGYTLLEMVFALFVLALTVAVFPLFMSAVVVPEKNDSYAEQETILFFAFLARDIHDSVAMEKENQSLILLKPSGARVRYEHYKNLIRRRVNRQGHIVLLQNVRHVKFTMIDENRAVFVTIVDERGMRHQRIFSLYVRNTGKARVYPSPCNHDRLAVFGFCSATIRTI